MKPVYLDLHIHTSDDPAKLNESYNLDLLITKVKEIAKGDDFLISLTDHNTINEKIYLEAVTKLGARIVLGVELHIKAYDDPSASSYHCHIYFDLEEINTPIIQDLNLKLDELYPNKKPEKTDSSIPNIQRILNTFDSYSFILLPHGGQSHATFDSAMPEGKNFDNLMERSIYYNFLDGFTSRSNIGTEKTIEYLKRLGVSEFVNLVTCTDNYDPAQYPNPKAKKSSEFIPTWMYATPDFAGLRISLTDSSRFEYNKEKPKVWREFIKSVKLKNDKLDIDTIFTPGLNVIIGESSSGKTMLVDSIKRKLSGVSFDDSKYQKDYKVADIEIDFPDNTVPHVIDQNFISKVIGDDKNINEIDIVDQIFPKNNEARKVIDNGLLELKKDLESLFDSVEEIEKIQEDIKTIPVLSNLISTKKVSNNILRSFFEVVNAVPVVDYSTIDKNSDTAALDNIEQKLENSPYINHDKTLVEKLKSEIEELRGFSLIDEKIRSVVSTGKSEVDVQLEIKHGEDQSKNLKFEKLTNLCKRYCIQLDQFNSTLEKITNYSINADSAQIEIQGHILSVENKFALSKDSLQRELNKLLLSTFQISDIDKITPSDLFNGKFKNNQTRSQRTSKSPSYKDIKKNISSGFDDSDKTIYKIITSDGRDFDKLSPGLKTSVILELIINFNGDDAPLIIDQPEDNLATSYINGGLVDSIKRNKRKKQIIFVSHNATIPMSGDAQNLILCENINGKITIKSSPLEGKINNKNTVDHIARITDGGKSSVKKRFKKYDLKQFKD